MGVEMGAGGGLSHPWILKLLEKRLFFQFRGVENKFHQFCPPPWKKIWENTLLAPLEKILPTPMAAE